MAVGVAVAVVVPVRPAVGVAVVVGLAVTERVGEGVAVDSGVPVGVEAPGVAVWAGSVGTSDGVSVAVAVGVVVPVPDAAGVAGVGDAANGGGPNDVGRAGTVADRPGTATGGCPVPAGSGTGAMAEMEALTVAAPTSVAGVMPTAGAPRDGAASVGAPAGTEVAEAGGAVALATGAGTVGGIGVAWGRWGHAVATGAGVDEGTPLAGDEARIVGGAGAVGPAGGTVAGKDAPGGLAGRGASGGTPAPIAPAPCAAGPAPEAAAPCASAGCAGVTRTSCKANRRRANGSSRRHSRLTRERQFANVPQTTNSGPQARERRSQERSPAPHRRRRAVQPHAGPPVCNQRCG